MVTKTTGKPKKAAPGSGPSPQELRTAYQAHTLAQLLYAQLVTTHPWMHTVLEMNQTSKPWPRTGPGVGWNPMVDTGPTDTPWTGHYFVGSDSFPRG